MTPSFDPILHRYTLEGREIPGVTTILKTVGLYSDFAFLKGDRKYVQRGEAVHHFCRLASLGRWDRDSTHPEIVPYVDQFMEFCMEFRVRPIAWEFQMVTGRAAGAGDLLCEARSDEYWLMDLKSGAIPKAVGVQVGGYSELLKDPNMRLANPEANLGFKPADFRDKQILRKSLGLPGAEGNWKLKSYDEPRWVQIWRSALNVYSTRAELGLIDRREQ